MPAVHVPAVRVCGVRACCGTRSHAVAAGASFIAAVAAMSDSDADAAAGGRDGEMDATSSCSVARRRGPAAVPARRWHLPPSSFLRRKSSSTVARTPSPGAVAASPLYPLSCVHVPPRPVDIRAGGTRTMSLPWGNCGECRPSHGPAAANVRKTTTTLTGRLVATKKVRLPLPLRTPPASLLPPLRRRRRRAHQRCENTHVRATGRAAPVPLLRRLTPFSPSPPVGRKQVDDGLQRGQSQPSVDPSAAMR